MRRCFIFAAGTYYGLRERPRTGDLVLAADAGYLACRQAGVVPDLLLGDFDSMDQPADFDRIRRVPVEKDDTDTMLAVKTGLEQGCGEFYLYGGTGGKRLDHTLANLQTLLYLRRHGAGVVSMTTTSCGPPSRTRASPWSGTVEVGAAVCAAWPGPLPPA